jgi:hypothetical protein
MYFGFVWKSASRHSVRNQNTVTQDPLHSHRNSWIMSDFCRDTIRAHIEIMHPKWGGGGSRHTQLYESNVMFFFVPSNRSQWIFKSEMLALFCVHPVFWTIDQERNAVMCSEQGDSNLEKWIYYYKGKRIFVIKSEFKNIVQTNKLCMIRITSLYPSVRKEEPKIDFLRVTPLQ